MPVLAAVLIPANSVTVRAQALAGARERPGAEWIGRRVVPKTRRLVLQDGPGDITVPGFYRYRVKQAVGGRLLLQMEDDGVGGWVAADQIIPVEPALEYFTERIHTAPGDAYAYIRRAICWGERKDPDRMLADLKQAAELDPENPIVYDLRGYARLVRGEYHAAIAESRRAVRLDPKEALTYARSARAWLNLRKLAAALADSETAIRLDPACSLAYATRGCVWLDRGKLDVALADFDEAHRLDPRNALAHLGRGVVRESRKDYGNALADYDEANRLDPTMVLAHNGSAWIRATCPDASLRDGRKAVASATRACELTKWQVATLIDTLAAAYAEAGDFDAAVKWQAKANAMFPEGHEKTDGEACLKLYRARTAFHAPNP
jgi:tetratricopeptide (TPR) repeat protein